MFIVTTLSFDELGQLIREKQVSLDNGHLLFGASADVIDSYFKERIGYRGYVVGLRGRINPATAKVFSVMDRTVKTGGHVILEAEIEEQDMLRYSVDGISTAAAALAYGLPQDDVYEQLDEAMRKEASSDGIEVICVPYIKANGKVKVTSLTEDLAFNVEGITFVKLQTGGI